MLNNNIQNNQEKEYWRPQVNEIKEDSIHSSLYLSEQALKIIEEYIERQPYRNRTELIQNLSKLGNALVRAKPLMALIYARAHRVIQFIHSIPREERNIEQIKQMVLEEIRQIRKESAEKQKIIARLGSRMILERQIVLTHSASGIVESILTEAHRLKRKFRLICTESRPRFEGVQLAKKMAKAGIKTRLIPDADITRAVKEAHFVLTGTDRITENSFINKTGTGALAILTNEMNKPFYIAADCDKILLKRTYPVRFTSVNPKEICKNPPENLTVQNIYFEEIPLSYIHKIICEYGIFEKEEFIERFL